ncbi:hypothetical protein B0F90DRAFT_1729005 [Multifurca ochricompacta]|uniref:Secreted protein n=1 Tax=Multifurca ochricompacta TaxID=376703 RepID=A0AAD4QLG5_9AGAM|nr:hypothetical protein B0F90DRAFT_1729005 [Multifurca ochricompacta]
MLSLVKLNRFWLHALSMLMRVAHACTYIKGTLPVPPCSPFFSNVLTLRWSPLQHVRRPYFHFCTHTLLLPHSHHSRVEYSLSLSPCSALLFLSNSTTPPL